MWYIYIVIIILVSLFVVSVINLIYTLKIYFNCLKDKSVDNPINKIYKKLSKNK